MTDEYLIRDDCRRYLGEKPCEPGKVCRDCPDYEPVGRRLLVIKLAAAGDVLRTTPILPALKDKNPDAWITWLTDEKSRFVLERNPHIDELLSFDLPAALSLQAREFQWVAVLDKEPRATALGELVRAGEKVGFGMNSMGKARALDPGSEYALRLGVDDELKFRLNDKTYPEIVFEMCGLDPPAGEYVFVPDPAAREKARDSLLKKGLDANLPVVGLNTGCGDVFATKKWTEEGFVELAERLVDGSGVQVLILGGPEERERNRRIVDRLGDSVVDAGCDNPPEVFTGILEACDVVVTADTLAFHLALALKKEVILLMGPTSVSEIEMYGRGELLTAGLDCAPCYLQNCSKGAVCMSALTPEMVLAAISASLERIGRDGEDGPA